MLPLVAMVIPPLFYLLFTIVSPALLDGCYGDPWIYYTIAMVNPIFLHIFLVILASLTWLLW